MSYYITTWEDVEKAHDEWEDSECERSEKLDDYVYELECFAEHDFEGLYCSEKFHEDISFDWTCELLVKDIDEQIKKLNKHKETLNKLIEDYKWHRSH